MIKNRIEIISYFNTFLIKNGHNSLCTNYNYYPFGSLMPGRYSGGNDYIYGYQGSEKDNEITGVEGANMTTYFREIDTRLGRMWSVDPVEQPWQTPYASMDNSPIQLNDPLGNVAGFGGKGGSSADATAGSGDPNSSLYLAGGGTNGNGQYTFGGNTNTQKGLLNFSFTPASFSQLYGSAKWKEQNDNDYVNPFDPNFTTFNPDETSALWTLNFTIASSQNTSFSVGLGFSKAKGGFLGADNKEHTHFFHGNGIFGGNAEFNYGSYINGIGFSGSLSLIAGPAIGGYMNGDDRFSSPFIRLGGGPEGFGVRGYGAALYAGVNFSIGSSFLQKTHGSDVFRLAFSVLYGVHSVKFNSYSNLTTGDNYPSKTLGLSGLGGGVKLSYDVSKPRSRRTDKPARGFK